MLQGFDIAAAALDDPNGQLILQQTKEDMLNRHVFVIVGLGFADGKDQGYLKFCTYHLSYL